jgi:DNA repair protein RadA/Sms
MAKSELVYACQSCGHVERKWTGRCSSCGAWSSFVEERAPARGASRAAVVRPLGRAMRITDVDIADVPRTPLALGDLDRVLGGGLVPGSLVLIGGEPGVGKSTLLLEVAKRMAQKGLRTLYVSAEESLAQTRMRAERLGALHPDIFLLAETDLFIVLEEVRAHLLSFPGPRALILDSVQTLSSSELDAAPGSVSQVREVTQRALQLAKGEGICTLLVGHVTKEGALAGPKTLEHMVDAVLSFEPTRSGPHRVLRATKNRFGSTNEIAVFEMKGEGMIPVDNPSALFLAERPKGRPGSSVAATIEGTRPLLVEVQALCVATPFGNPRRTTTGIDTVRVAMLAAVLERRAGLSLLGQDLFVNVAGGAVLDEPAADLPVALAIASSLKNKPLDPELACFGEVGLSGEIRGVARTEPRLEEIARQGFARALVPVTGTDGVRAPAGLALLRVKSLEEAIELAFAP